MSRSKFSLVWNGCGIFFFRFGVATAAVSDSSRSASLFWSLPDGELFHHNNSGYSSSRGGEAKTVSTGEEGF